MKQAPYKSYGWRAWSLGLLVLAALGAAVAMMLHHNMRDDANPKGRVAARATDGPQQAAAIPQLDLQQKPARVVAGEIVQGTVFGPHKRPVPTATVTLFRLLTAWPEWRMEAVDEALTDNQGSFEFRVPARRGHVVGFEHPRFAGGLQEVPLQPAMLQLRLRPGFRLFGVVLNDAGAPVPNAKVALESVPGEFRRAQVTQTSADGAYEFRNLAAGPARLVAHHPSWQPSVAPALVIGDRRRFDLRFERPTMAPLRGRVVSAVTQAGVAGAQVQLVPINQELGLVDPIAVTTRDDGSFLVEGLSRGSMRMLVRHPEYGAVRRAQSIRAVAQDATIELPPRSFLAGQLVEERFDGVLQGGEVLELTDFGGDLHYTKIDADGSFRFADPVSPGWGTLRAVDDTFAFQRSYISTQSVLIREEDVTELELAVVLPSKVRGRIVDAAGEPVAGVRVIRTRMLADSAKRIGDAAWDMDFSGVGTQFARLFGSGRDKLLAITDESGRYEVRGFRAGPLLARSEHRGYGSTWLRMMVPSPGKPLERADTVLRRGARISGVVLRRRQPLAGATVIAIGPDCQGTAITDRSGSYVIPGLVPGTYRVRARITGQSTGSDEQTVRTEPTNPATGVNIRLQIGRTIRGLVTSTAGQPLANVLVSVRGARGQVKATDGVGNFEIDVPDEQVELLVSLGDRSRQQTLLVPADQDDVVVELDSPPTCTLKAHVFALPGRQRMLGALLRLTALDDAAADTRTRWVKLEGGELSWPLCPSGEVKIEILCDGYAPYGKTLVLAPNKVHDLGDVLLEPGARLRGHVRSSDGAAIDGAVVMLGEEGDLDLYEPSVRTATDGFFELQGVTSRSSQLVVRAPGYAVTSLDLVLPRDVLSRDPLEVVLERGATIEVRLRDGRDATVGLVQLRRKGRLLGTAELDEKGRAWFANRSAGTYSVEMFGGEVEPVQVTIEHGASIVRVELSPPAK